MPIILASKSPRRKALLAQLTTNFTVLAAKVDEDAFSAHTPALLAEILATEKAQAVFLTDGASPVLACDTVVDLNGQVLGKPKDEAHAIEMLSALSGQKHLVHTGVCLKQPGGQTHHFTETTRVFFNKIPKHEILAVAKTPEPYDKAGAYGIQGWAARHISRVEGCYYNVMGLPLAALYHLLCQENLL